MKIFNRLLMTILSIIAIQCVTLEGSALAPNPNFLTAYNAYVAQKNNANYKALIQAYAALPSSAEQSKVDNFLRIDKKTSIAQILQNAPQDAEEIVTSQEASATHSPAQQASGAKTSEELKAQKARAAELQKEYDIQRELAQNRLLKVGGKKAYPFAARKINPDKTKDLKNNNLDLRLRNFEKLEKIQAEKKLSQNASLLKKLENEEDEILLALGILDYTQEEKAGIIKEILNNKPKLLKFQEEERQEILDRLHYPAPQSSQAGSIDPKAQRVRLTPEELAKIRSATPEPMPAAPSPYQNTAIYKGALIHIKAD